MVKKDSFKHSNSELILKYVLGNIVFKKHDLVINGVSSYDSLVDYDQFNKLFTPYADKFCSMAGEGFNIIDFWINIVEPGGYTKTHNHISLIKELKNVPQKTGVFYLQKPRQSGNLHIEDNLIKVKKNDILVFDPWLNHGTEKNKSKKQRIIFSVNMAKGINKIYENGKFSFIKT